MELLPSSIYNIRYNILSGCLAGISSLIGKFGVNYVSQNDSIEKIIGVLVIGLSIYVNTLMIMFFYKSLKILGVTFATALNFSFNIGITVSIYIK